MEDQQKTIGERTRDYITAHLDPFMWTIRPGWGEVADTSGVDESEVAHVIRQMGYGEFLQTPYWHAVADKVKERAGNRCERCGGEIDLKAHHTTYAHHGWEHLNLDDMVCLCRRCHDIVHGRQRPA